MNRWKKIQIQKAIKFNPPESISKGSITKKIPMGNLTEFQKKINGFEYAAYNSGPKFRNGDTLLAKITPCLENGKTAKVDLLEDGEIAFGSSEFIVLRNTELTDPDFIYYLSISPTFRARAISCMEGTSGRKRVNDNTLKLFEYPFPPLPTQKVIAKVLSDLDAKIEINNKINEKLEAMAKLIYDYWFVQFDFPDENGKPYKSSGGKMVYNEVLKREIPEGWGVDKFSKIADIVGGTTPSRSNESYFTDNGIAWITPNDMSNNKGKVYIEKGEIDITTEGQKSASLKILPKNSILFTSRAPIGYVALNSIPVTTNQGFKSFVPLDEDYSYFLYFTTKLYVPVFEQYSSGSTFSEISKTVIEFIKIHIPDKKLIKKFQEKVNPIFRKILNAEKQNQKLADLRDWLLPMLMNGQVSVDQAAERVDEGMSMAAEEEVRYGEG